MRTALAAVLVALVAASPAAGAKLKVSAPRDGVMVVRSAKKLRLVSRATDPKVGRGRVRLRLTRAAGCVSGRVVVRGYRNRAPQRAVGKAVSRGAVTVQADCGKPAAPKDLGLPDGGSCDQLDPALCLQPFPSDRFRVNGRISFPAAAMPVNVSGLPASPAAYAGNDGFSPGSALITRVPGIESPEKLRATGAAPIDDIGRSYRRRAPVVVIDAASGRRWPVWAESDVNPADPADRNVIVRPARNFLEGHRYIVALRRMGGAKPSAAFGALRDGVVSTDDSLEARRRHFEDLFATLARSGVARDDLFLAWDFTIASERNLSERMLHIRDDAFASLGDRNLADLEVQGKSPRFEVTKVEDDPDGPEGEIMRRVEGTVEVPCYLNSLNCEAGGSFNYVDGKPAANGVQQTRITCNIPRVASAGAPLRAGIYGHGLLGSRGEVNQGQLKALSQNHGFVFCATDWSGMACSDLPDTDADGVLQLLADGAAGTLLLPNCDIPTVGTILVDISNFPKLSDRVQQGMLDFLFVGRAMIHPQGLSTDPAFKVDGKSVIDTSHLYYDGNSQGGIIGGALISVAPDLDRGVVGVVGMNYSTLLRRSVDFDTYAQFLYNAYPDELERPVLLQLLQMLWDRAETDGYAQHMTTDPYPNTPRHTVLMHIGFGDHQVTNYAAKVEARTIGAHGFFPWTDAGRDTDKHPLWGIPAIRGASYGGSAIVMWDSGSPAPPKDELPPRTGEDPHELPRRSPLGQQQKSDFLRPGGVLKDVCGAKPCYAGDKAPKPQSRRHR
jgi:hypothetical protein